MRSVGTALAAVIAGALLISCTRPAPDDAPVGTVTVSTAAASPSTADPTTTTALSAPVATGTAVTSTPVTVPVEASDLPMPSDTGTVQAANPQEEADRAAIEAVWRQFWALYENITAVPPQDRAARAGAILADPALSQLLEVAAKADAAGVEFYGSSTLHPYWYRSVDGRPYAVLGDCRDASMTGARDRTTGEKRSVGVAASNTVGSFIRDATGAWKLWQVTYLTDLPCTPPAAP